jgi:hypothetical protein
VPQTREEFVSAVSAGARGAKVETLVVERSLDEVYRTLEARMAPCLDKKVERTAYVGYVEHSSSDYNPTLRRVGRDRGEFSLQVVHFPAWPGREDRAGRALRHGRRPEGGRLPHRDRPSTVPPSATRTS